MKKTPLNKVSRKRQDKNVEYFELIRKLRELCGNRSEISGKRPDWKTKGKVEPHHIGGRSGDRLTDPFEIVMLVRDEHNPKYLKRNGWTKERLYHEVEKLRIQQGYRKEKDDG